MRVTVFVEGGGGKDVNIECRRGFRTLIENAGFTGRMPRFVACGSRNDAYDRFKIAVATAEGDEYSFLLVDSEDPVNATPWDHLNARDGWICPSGVDDEQAQLMVACMETWIMADRRALRQFFGSDLQASALLPEHNLEQRSRDDVQRALENATRPCGRRRIYTKGRRSYQVLACLDPDTLQGNLSYFQRLIDALQRYL